VGGDPKLASLWDTFVQEVLQQTRWGAKMPAMGYADDVEIIKRPTHSTLQTIAFETISEQRYSPLKRALSAHVMANSGQIDALSKAFHTLSKGNADIQFYVTNAQRPLFLWDVGGFRMDRIINQLIDKQEFIDDVPALTDAMRYADEQFLNSEAGFSVIANGEVRRIIENKGYDHIAYINTVEFPGTPSFIFWKKNSIRPVESFGVPGETTKLLAAPVIAAGLAFQLSGEEEEKPDNSGT